ncbi:cysteine-rich RLK (RECEPTOR-like protein kinase) 8 [Striga hermonthica]|uniref:Cysteine-rich RLK (RECEPTOR-like protein kinase) 8 n=1 Tax=Striga hermonthica TaxID=68872 RepID=A0A9N7R7A7_STRHE|nr:cysteine-rich RLK (RECEPTOR-like protein kinase) 8 [Striga hermonthica]
MSGNSGRLTQMQSGQQSGPLMTSSSGRRPIIRIVHRRDSTYESVVRSRRMMMMIMMMMMTTRSRPMMMTSRLMSSTLMQLSSRSYSHSHNPSHSHSHSHIHVQKSVALSTTEAEYIAMAEADKEMLWLKRFLQQLGMKQERYDIHCDSQSALDLSKNAMYHSPTKHIDVRYHWLRQVVKEQQFRLEKIHTNKNPADMMKVVTGGKLQLCAELIGMDCM